MILDTRCEIRFTRPVLSVVEGYERRNTSDEIGLVLSFFVTIGIPQAFYDRAGKRWTLKEMFDIMYDPKSKEYL